MALSSRGFCFKRLRAASMAAALSLAEKDGLESVASSGALIIMSESSNKKSCESFGVWAKAKEWKITVTAKIRKIFFIVKCP